MFLGRPIRNWLYFALGLYGVWDFLTYVKRNSPQKQIEPKPQSTVLGVRG